MIRDSKNIVPVGMAVGLHIIIFGSMIVALDYARPMPFTPLAVQATLVQEIPDTAPPPPVVEPEPEPVIEEPEPEPDNSAELRRQAEEEKRRLDALLEQKRLDELKQRERDEAERKKREEEDKERKRVEAERKREEDIQRQREENARVERELEEQFRAQQIEDEERRRGKEDSPAMDAYVFAIRQRIQRHWNAPASMRDDLVCVVRVRQVPGGDVIAVSITDNCNGDDAVRRSIIAAVNGSSPFPEPSDPDLFRGNLELTMSPESQD